MCNTACYACVREAVSLKHLTSVSVCVHTCNVNILHHSKGSSCTGASGCAWELDGGLQLTIFMYIDVLRFEGPGPGQSKYNMLMYMDAACCMD